jgi:hypothetical protein
LLYYTFYLTGVYKMYRPEPQDGFPQEEYYFYITYIGDVEDSSSDEDRPAEGDYEDPHFQAWLDKMEDRERLLEEVPW